MSNFHKYVLVSAKATALSVVFALVSVNAQANKASIYGIGSKATAEQIAGWDIDVRPDGTGLPEGQGSVEDGEVLFEEKCAACHGAFGEGEGRWPVLAGGQGTLAEERPTKTVGSYWPYASTLWDYIRRAMPFPQPQSLSVDEVYAITAFVLNLNEIVDEDFVLTKDNFTSIEMPNKDGFYVDDRPDVKNPRCMNNCKKTSDINVRYTIAGITPTAENSGKSYEEDENHNVTLSANALAGEKTYNNACKACHETGLMSAPIVGEKEAWKNRIGHGMAVLYKHALHGFNAMPAKGGQTQLADDDVTKAVDFMVESSQ